MLSVFLSEAGITPHTTIGGKGVKGVQPEADLMK